MGTWLRSRLEVRLPAEHAAGAGAAVGGRVPRGVGGERGGVGGVVDEHRDAGVHARGGALLDKQPGDVAALVRFDEHSGRAGVVCANELVHLALADEVADLWGCTVKPWLVASERKLSRT